MIIETHVDIQKAASPHPSSERFEEVNNHHNQYMPAMLYVVPAISFSQ
jgi:hypothetical protein